eukprot:2346807-Pyramimonas_sp.AAC.1
MLLPPRDGGVLPRLTVFATGAAGCDVIITPPALPSSARRAGVTLSSHHGRSPRGGGDFDIISYP